MDEGPGGCVAFLRSMLKLVKLVLYFGYACVELLLHRPRTKREGAEWLHRFCARVIKGFDVRVTVVGEFPQAGALISDHLGYLDIITYAALCPVVFFSKAELEHTPVLGFMATAAGSVYVERGAGGSSERARSGLKSAAAQGIPVLFFPEGTTSNGEQLLPFRSGLLGEALSAEEPVTAAHIHYTFDEPNPGFSLEDDVAYWGDINLLAHIPKFLKLKGVHAWVRLAPAPIVFSAAALADRKVAAVEAREAVMALSGDFYASQAGDAAELVDVKA